MSLGKANSIKRGLIVLTLPAVIASPAWAVYHEENLLAVEILSEGEIIHIHSEYAVSKIPGSKFKFVDYHVIYADRYFTCQYNQNTFDEPVVFCVEVQTR